MHSYYTVANYEGTDYLLKLFAEEAVSLKNGEIFTRAYELKDIKKVAALPNGVLSQTGGLTDGNTSTTLTVADIAAIVKKYDKSYKPKPASKVVNEDGTPKIVYHQTENEFTVFETRREGAGTRDNGTPFGIFLKSSNKDIGLRGKKQMALYARIESPLRAKNRSELLKAMQSMSSEYAEIINRHEALDREYKEKTQSAMREFKNYMIEWRADNPGVDSRALYDDAKFNELFEAEDTLVSEWTEKADMLSTKAKEALTKALESNGYDGVILERDDGSFGRSTDAYIALRPEQVKSATDNIGTFDSSIPDIRYSREPERLNELRRQNERKLAQATAEDAANENERGLDLKASLVFYVLCICRGCRFGIVRGRTLHADLQQQRSYKGRHYDHEDYRGEHRSGYEPGHAALLCNYQRDLAARYHAEADGDGVVGLEAGEPCTDAAADDLGDDGDEGQDNCEQNEVAVKPGKLGFYADGGKEYRGEEHITHRVYTLDYIGSRLAVVAEHDAGKVRAGYIGDAEEVLGNKAEQEAEGKRVDGYAPVDAVKPRAQSAKQLVHDDRHDGKEDKIRDDADKYHGRLNGGVREAREHGQNDDAEHVVNDGGGHDRCADAAFELAHLTQSLDRYRHRGRGQNDADERGLYHFKAVRLAVEQKITARTAEKRHDNADRGYDESRQPRMLELLEVRIEAGHEHEDDNADLGGLYEKVRFADEPEAARPEQQTRDQRAYDLRHVDLFARNAENFC